MAIGGELLVAGGRVVHARLGGDVVGRRRNPSGGIEASAGGTELAHEHAVRVRIVNACPRFDPIASPLPFHVTVISPSASMAIEELN